ncbi:hypothetical protein HY636_03830 [Candidatus Woesearchaeota archaeon]|nr:hypothetical protein [Candidatus Woesearchaeota archaeon]
MLNFSIILKHYKRKDIQEALLSSSKDREVSVRFGENGFGKRPDVLNYPNEILEFAKQGVTSFHVSEEHWNNVLALKPELSKRELDELRKGWDLVLDIDCKYWEYSKLIAHLLVQQLKEHGITSVTVKFSGSKGFHIGVPFEAFPKSIPILGKLTETRILFPEAPRRISLYLKDRIEPILLNELLKNKTKKEIAEMTSQPESELFKIYCKKCGAESKKSSKQYFVCPSCQEKVEENNVYNLCPKCKQIMEKITISKPRCYKCSNTTFEEKFNSSLILDIDTILISSRHLYRAPYSLHEKSGLCSIVIPLDNILDFKKEDATPSTVIPNLKFLDITNTKEGEASRLIIEAFDYKPIMQEGDETLTGIAKDNKEYEVPEEAIPVSMFPPCMLKGLQGIQDGKKRFMFALINFLECCGYENDSVDKIVREWNSKNPEKLREVIVNSQLRYRKMQKREKIMPPNCMQAYQEIGLCAPDNLCRKIKNPVSYAKAKAFIFEKEEKAAKKPKREPLTEEQKEMRRKHREELKNNSKNKT